MAKAKDQGLKIVSAEKTSANTRKSPMTLLRERAGGDYWGTEDVANHFGVVKVTIERFVKQTHSNGRKVVKAPSQAVVSGGAKVWLYSKRDVLELEEALAKKGYVFTPIDPELPLTAQIPEPRES